MMKDGAASDMFGDMQSPAIHTEEQLSTQLVGQGFTLSRLCLSVMMPLRSSHHCYMQTWCAVLVHGFSGF